jgi:hypothetical protein
VPNVQWKTPDDGQRNCPKHVEILDKNKFGKISASVGFIKKKFVRMHGHMNAKDPCNIWPECFCSCRWFRNVFLIVNTKIFETHVSIQE